MSFVEDTMIKLTQLVESQQASSYTPPAPPLPATTPTVLTTNRRLSLTPQVDDAFHIPESLLRDALLGCRSQRNLAGRLADLLFTETKKKTSNFSVVLNKQRLDQRKTDAIK